MRQTQIQRRPNRRRDDQPVWVEPADPDTEVTDDADAAIAAIDAALEAGAE